MRLCVCYKGTIQRPTRPGQGNTTAVSLGGHYKTLSVPRNPPFIGPCKQLGRICLALLLEREGAARPRQGWGQHGLPTPRFLRCLGGEHGAGKASNSLKKKKFSRALLSARLFISERPKGSKNTTQQGCQVLGFSAAAAQLTSPGNLFLPSADCWKAGIQDCGKERRAKSRNLRSAPSEDSPYHRTPQSPRMLRATIHKSRTKQGTSQPV